MLNTVIKSSLFQGNTPCENIKTWKNYKELKTFEQRKNEAKSLLSKYPDKTPLIINECCDEYKHKLKRKMLLPIDMTIGQLMFSLRSKYNINKEEALLIFIGTTMPKSSSLISELHKQYKDEDGFLYVTILKENVFG
jgi:GABA(A) receptor-associated protein